MHAFKNFQTTRRSAWMTLAAFILALAGTPAQANPLAAAQASDGGAGVTATVTGGGVYQIGGALDIKFAVNAIQRAEGVDSGNFRHEVTFQDQLVSFSGIVTCVEVDSETGRAWIGGVITQNRSEHPSFSGDIHQPGQDIWFRVLDSGEGQAEPDRSTFTGFKGGAGIITSEEYCELKIWPDDNARTSPVISGNIHVRP